MAIKKCQQLKNSCNRSHNINKVCDLSFVAVDKDILYWRYSYIFMAITATSDDKKYYQIWLGVN